MRYFLALGLFGVLASAPPAFLDATASLGIGLVFEAGKTPAKYLIEAMGGGVAMIDADRDGRLDLVFVNGAAQVLGPLPDGRGSVSDGRGSVSDGRGSVSDGRGTLGRDRVVRRMEIQTFEAKEAGNGSF